MKIEQVLSKYGHLIKDWDSDKDEQSGDGGYFIYLKRPYVIKDCGHVTDMISRDTLEEVVKDLKEVYKDAEAWDNL